MAYGTTATTPTNTGLKPYTSSPGIDESFLSDFFRTALGVGGAQSKSPLAGTLNQLGQGMIPAATQQQFQTELGRSNAAITESFGKMGARFGTDLADTLARNSNEANVNLQSSAWDKALQAIGLGTGIGTTTAGFDFQRQEGGLDRALKDFLTRYQVDAQGDIVSLLLQAALGGG